MSSPFSDGLSRPAFLILLALANESGHGLGIIDRVERATRGAVKLGPGTLYGALHGLVEAGFIRETADRPDPAHDDPRRRYYRLTPKGERALKADAEKLRVLVDAARERRVLGGA
jgi:DNA-binding PadR family transcriptional regulator